MSYLYNIIYPQIRDRLQQLGYTATQRFERIYISDKITRFFSDNFCFLVTPSLFLPHTQTLAIHSDLDCVRWGVAEYPQLGDAKYACFFGDITIALQHPPTPCTFLDFFCIAPQK